MVEGEVEGALTFPRKVGKDQLAKVEQQRKKTDTADKENILF